MRGFEYGWLGWTFLFIAVSIMSHEGVRNVWHHGIALSDTAMQQCTFSETLWCSGRLQG